MTREHTLNRLNTATKNDEEDAIHGLVLLAFLGNIRGIHKGGRGNHNHGNGNNKDTNPHMLLKIVTEIESLD